MNILDAIGNTPLFELKNFSDLNRNVKIYAKAEFMNPGGSIKDRAAKAMILQGIEQGSLTKDKVILDATSGNTGISYAMIGAVLGYQVTLCLPANVSVERKKIIKAYGAQIIETSPLDGVDGAYYEAHKLVEEHPGKYFYPDQYNNDANWKTHYLTTAEEIWNQTNHSITHFVAGAGTSGTFVGTVRKLKKLRRDIQGILMQPDSPFHGLEGVKHIASTMAPGIFDANLPDGKTEVSTEETYRMVKILALEEGLFVGISSAANVIAAMQVAKEAPEGSVIVTVLGDGGSRYLSEPVWEELS